MEVRMLSAGMGVLQRDRSEKGAMLVRVRSADNACDPIAHGMLDRAPTPSQAISNLRPFFVLQSVHARVYVRHQAPEIRREAQLGAWPTPMAQTPAQNGNNEAGNSDSSRKTVEMCQWPVDPLTAFGETPIGYLLGPNGWEIVPACGQLNGSHSRWLMGLPESWDRAAIAASRSLKARKRG